MALAIRLAREGYGGGDPKRILEMDAGLVVTMLHYERFLIDYARADRALNAPGETA